MYRLVQITIVFNKLFSLLFIFLLLFLKIQPTRWKLIKNIKNSQSCNQQLAQFKFARKIVASWLRQTAISWFHTENFQRHPPQGVALTSIAIVHFTRTAKQSLLRKSCKLQTSLSGAHTSTVWSTFEWKFQQKKSYISSTGSLLKACRWPKVFENFLISVCFRLFTVSHIEQARFS